MKHTRLIMGMPVTLILPNGNTELINEAFEYFRYVDETYSPFKPGSEVSKINAGLPESRWLLEMRSILALCEQTKHETNGYFDAWRGGKLDPSGLVKGWAIHNVALWLGEVGQEDFYVEAGGDIEVSGTNANKKPWRIGIRNPFNRDEIVKVVELAKGGIATSGTAVRGQHIYNPHQLEMPLTDVVSLTVIGPDIYEADRFATAAFAMGKAGVEWIESLPGLEGYMVSSDRTATVTTGFGGYEVAGR
ncbi:MAG TPA: FAD:protein FMN transferase [Candidatus Acidoferrum sp.]|nr:FAD:protein FMN transferase [Candidatus Acidoferrum sp.]